MTDETTNVIPLQSPSKFSPARLHTELAKMLKLVAPISMSAEAQAVWIAAAADALEDIRAAEVVAVSQELRRTVTRPSQIVPEIAKLVAERRAKASARIQPLPVQFIPPPRPNPPLTIAELDAMMPLVRTKGLNSGFLKYESGVLVEA